MKINRYDILGEKFDYETSVQGEVVFYDDIFNFILARIKELETELNSEDSEYSEVSCRVRIDELKNLLK